MDTLIDPDDFDALETVEQTPERKRRPTFALMLDACGLTSTDEAMRYLGQSRSSIEKKRAGSLEATAADTRALSILWHEIRSGRVSEEWTGPREMATAMLFLTGRKAAEAAKRGRPPVVPKGMDVSPKEYQRQQAEKAMWDLIAKGGRDDDED